MHTHAVTAITATHLVVPVAKVEASNIHASINHLDKLLDAPARGTNGTHDLRACIRRSGVQVGDSSNEQLASSPWCASWKGQKDPESCRDCVHGDV